MIKIIFDGEVAKNKIHKKAISQRLMVVKKM